MNHETFKNSKRNVQTRLSAETTRDLAIAIRVGVAAILIYFCWLVPEHDAFWLVVGRVIAAVLIFSAIQLYGESKARTSC